MLNVLVPAFIKKTDKYFLLNHPILWISKIHYVLYYAVIMWALSALIGMGVPVNISKPQDIALWYILFSILAIILFCIWIYRNAIFNVEKKFGNRHWTDEFKLFLLYFASVFIFFSFAYPFAMVYNTRVANTFTDQEFIQDVNTLNAARPFIPDQLNNYYNYYDSTKKETFYDINRCIEFGQYTPYALKDKNEFNGILNDAQDLKAIYLRNKSSDQSILKALEGWNSVMKRYGLNNELSPEKTLSKYKAMCSHWQVRSDQDDFYYSMNDYEISRTFDNLAEAKFKTIFLFRMDFILFVFYFTLYTVMFFLLFRNNQWQHYLITIITLIVLPILLFIIGQIIPYDAGYGSRDIIFDTGTLAVFFLGLFFTIEFLVRGKTFSPFRNICMQLMYLLFPVTGMLIVYYLQRHTDVFHNNIDDLYASLNDNLKTALNTNQNTESTTPEFWYSRLVSDHWARQYNCWFNAFQVLGVIGFIAVIMPLMKEVFVKQIALPRRK